MITSIKKRDGRVLPFDQQKIEQAIAHCFMATGSQKSEDTAKELAQVVVAHLENDESIPTVPTVEQVQDVVEKVLIERGFVRSAKAYILYRAERSRVREMSTRLMKTFEDIASKDAIDSDIKRENANINGDTAMGAMLKFGSEGSKQYYEMNVLDPRFSQAHREGEIHIHDLDFYTLTTTCCQIDLLDLFKNGFSTGHGVLREPNDIYSYSALACIAIQANQNDQHGGQSIVNFDYGMAPGVKKTYRKRFRDNLARALELLGDVEDALDKAAAITEEMGEDVNLSATPEADQLLKEKVAALLPRFAESELTRIVDFVREHAEKETEKATYQAMEALIHNLNTMNSRAGAQVPFSSINYGMDTSPEGRMVMRNVLLATEAGLGNGETPIFPIQIFRVKEGISFNPGDPNYDLYRLAIRTSAKRLFPNFSFVDAPFNKRYYKEGHPETEIAYMGCRTRV
ncbi:MAG: anaerobic ribonucleoside triphosphate reductase, partial [Oscillospiraceae bacterium]|nr:anaerobic ribonucleoside triphosphate reductase [Oscillospiraceae bacterium]